MGWWVSLPAPLAPHETIQGLSSSAPQKTERVACAEAGCTVRVDARSWRPLCKRGLSFLPLCTAPVVCCVVTPAAATFKLLAWGRALPGGVRLTTGNTPGCVSAVTLRVAEALVALTLKRGLWATYVSTETLKPKISDRDRIF